MHCHLYPISILSIKIYQSKRSDSNKNLDQSKILVSLSYFWLWPTRSKRFQRADLVRRPTNILMIFPRVDRDNKRVEESGWEPRNALSLRRFARDSLNPNERTKTVLDGFESLDEKRRENPSYVKRRLGRTERGVFAVSMLKRKRENWISKFSQRERLSAERLPAKIWFVRDGTRNDALLSLRK